MKAIWEEIKNQIRSEIPKNTYSLWIQPINFLEKKDTSIILSCPNKFSSNWVFENYFGLIQDKFHCAGANHPNIVFKVDPPKRKTSQSCSCFDSKQLPLPNIPRSRTGTRLSLNKDFTFDRFVVGPSNEFAYSASSAFARSDFLDYRSLLVLANTGLGKTHLSQAIGHSILQHNPQSRVFYITAEDFTNDMISSLKNNLIEDFKKKYRRSCDVLLLEEIHFLSGKTKTQAELGFTLDALSNYNKKIIFTSSLPPKDIPRMSKDLSSRLTSGLVTTIDKPDFETRVKILREKSLELNLILSEEIIYFLANRLKRDIRQMESSLKFIKAKSEFLKAKIDVSLAKDVVSYLISDERSITIQDIRDLVSRYYRIDPNILGSKSRKKTYSYPRNIYVYLSRRHTDSTLEDIAKTINRSHSTVLYASELVEHKIKTDARMRDQINFLTQKIDKMKT